MEKENSKKPVLAVLLVALVVTSGCLSVEINSTVSPDGKIEKYKMEMKMSQSVYSMMNQGGESSSKSLEAQLKSNTTSEFKGGTVKVDKSTSNGNVTITMTIKNAEPTTESDITIRKEGDTMVYVDDLSEGSSEVGGTQQQNVNMSQYADEISFKYRLDMPGKITSSNADQVNGDKATWEGYRKMNSKIRAESKITESGGGGGPLPGFTPVISILALLGVILLVRSRGN